MVTLKDDLARSEVGAPSRTYRLRVYYRNLGIVGTAFIVVVGIGSVLAAYFNVDGSFRHPGLAIAVFSIGWGAFTLLGSWLIAAYYRERLVLTGETICQQGVFRTTTISLSEIRELRWRLYPQGGSAVLTGSPTRIKVYFDNFLDCERREIVEALRVQLNEGCQTNWPAFEAQFMRPKVVSSQQRRAARRTASLAMISSAIVIAAMGLAGFGGHLYAVAILSLAIGVYALWLNLRSQNETSSEV